MLCHCCATFSRCEKIAILEGSTGSNPAAACSCLPVERPTGTDLGRRGTMAEKTVFRALFAAARVAAQTLVMSPAKAKEQLARRSALAAAKVVNQDLAKAAGKAASAAWSSLLAPKAGAYQSVMAAKVGSQGRAAGAGAGAGGRGRGRR